MFYGACIVKSDRTYTIGNSFVSRTFYCGSDKSIKTVKIINFRTEPSPTELVPGDKSEEFVFTVNKNKSILSSDLKVYSIKEIQVSGVDKCLEIIFEPYSFKGTVYTFKETVCINDDDFFMRKKVYLFVDRKDWDNVLLESVDIEHISPEKSNQKQYWSHPEQGGKNFEEFNRSLGQPLYLNSLFAGCEFPTADSHIDNNQTACVRCYSGKTFSEIKKNENGLFVTETAVIGACKSDDPQVMNNDFLEYIKSISLKNEFTVHYSTWFDQKRAVNEKACAKAFFETEKLFSQSGLENVSCFIVDKGWNDGESSFWNYKSEFPNELKNLSVFSELFNTPLGLWLGVSGTDYDFAKRIEMGGKGYINKKGKEACSACEVYQKNVFDFLASQLDKYNISCIKLDSFPTRPCNNKNHGHAVGGDNDMYFITELWERWIDIVVRLRKKQEENGKTLWVTLGKNAMQSPWLLQWFNAVWLQNSDKAGFTYKNNKKKELGGSDADAMITYRDDRYYNLFKTRQLQFPVSRIYNADPIYAKKADVKMNTSDFRKYMYMVAARGSSFWEFSYSCEMLNDEKREITAAVLNFAKNNADILENTRMIGGIPSFGEVYGYSAWNNSQGIVTLRNPSDFPQSFTFFLNSDIGVVSAFTDVTGSKIIPFEVCSDENKYKYGDSVTVELKPHDVWVMKFSPDKEPNSAILWEKVSDEQGITVAFSRPVAAKAENFTVNGEKALECYPSADYLKVRVRTKQKLEPGQSVNLKLENVADLHGNAINSELKLAYYKYDVFCEYVNGGTNKLGDITLDKSFTTESDFSICVEFSETMNNKLLVYQGNEYYVSIDTQGKLRFYAKEIGVVSNSYVDTGKKICATLVCESNGTLKIYLDGQLDAVYYRRGVGCPVIEPFPISVNFCVEAFKIVNRAYSYDEIPEFLTQPASPNEPDGADGQMQ